MRIRRVIVGLPSMPRDQAVIEAAARLARQMEAELVGLFVEDVDLLRFAELPFAQELGAASATRRALDAPRMERSMRALAAEMKRTLAGVAERIPVRWSFRVARGSVGPELLAIAAAADLLIANIELPAGAARAERVRMVRAGDIGALRKAIEEDDGILLLAGANEAEIGDTLLKLVENGPT